MKPDRRQQLDEAWLESLLETALGRPDRDSEQRMAKVMQRLDQAAQHRDQTAHLDSVQQNAVPPRTRSPWLSLRHLTALAIAASLLVMAVFVVDSSDHRAYAAVARSAQAAPVTRLYKVNMLFQRQRNDRAITASLYVDPKNRWVAEHPAFFGFGKIWMGGDSQQRWLVPPRGPALIGREQLMGRWLATRDEGSPLLHLNTLLERMSHAYRLTMLPDETLPTAEGGEVVCTHVLGETKARRSWLPMSIELWADVRTGVAQRLILKWPDNFQRRGPSQWTMELAAIDPPLASDWFELESHAGNRRIVTVSTEKELESVQ